MTYFDNLGIDEIYDYWTEYGNQIYEKKIHE